MAIQEQEDLPERIKRGETPVSLILTNSGVEKHHEFNFNQPSKKVHLFFFF